MNKNRDVREILRKSDWLSRRLGTRKDWKSKPRIGVYNNEREKNILECLNTIQKLNKNW